MSMMASQIASLTIVYSIVYSGADQRKLQSSMSLAFVRGIHCWPVNSLHKGPVTRKMFPFDDVIMSYGWLSSSGHGHGWYHVASIRHVTLVVITGTTILAPYHYGKSLQLIWRSGTRRFHLRVPDLQNELQRLDYITGCQDSILNDGCQGHTPWYIGYRQWSITMRRAVRSFLLIRGPPADVIRESSGSKALWASYGDSYW